MQPLHEDPVYLELLADAEAAERRAAKATRQGLNDLARAFALQASDRRRALAHMRHHAALVQSGRPD